MNIVGAVTNVCGGYPKRAAGSVPQSANEGNGIGTKSLLDDARQASVLRPRGYILAQQVREAQLRIRSRVQQRHREREMDRPFRESLRNLFEVIPGGTWREQ